MVEKVVTLLYENLPFPECTVGEETYKKVHVGDSVYWKLPKIGQTRSGVSFNFKEAFVRKVDASGVLVVNGNTIGAFESLLIGTKVKVECSHQK